MVLSEEDRRILIRLGVDPDLLEEQFTRATGPGGQHVNKASTAVTLTYPPLQLRVTSQDERSQTRNRRVAIERLIKRLEAAARQRKLQRAAAVSRQRRQLARRSTASKRRQVEYKRRRSETKARRQRPSPKD